MERPTLGQDGGGAVPASPQVPTEAGTHLLQQMRDYASVGLSLFWQRQMIFGAALLLAGYYYSARLAVVTLVLVGICEAFDIWTFRLILSRTTWNSLQLRRHLMLLYVGTLLSAATIVYYVIWISDLQGPTTHFMPLFFLFAASVFAAMNNHQILPILKMRITIYGLTFLFIPAWDIWRTGANIHSPLWTQMFTSVFVLYFIIDCSRIFLDLYRRQMRQMEELREEHERTKAAYRAKSEFLSTMSHELRTPMTSINGAVVLARSGQLGEVPKQVDSVLSIAQLNCGRLSSLINDVLDLQKIEAGKLEFHLEPMDLRRFVIKSADLNAPYGNKLNVSFKVELPEEEVIVEADERRMDQVMSNLLSNAAKFSNPGDTVTVRLEADGNSARILVIDTGVGLSEDHRELVFDQFSQLDASDTRPIGGTGLGLNICRRILDAHDATIDYHKNPGPGTTFIVEMKRSNPLPSALEAADEAA